MKTTGLVFSSRQHRGNVTPPNVLEDTSRFKNHGTFGAGAAAPTWVRLPSGLWVLSFDGADDYVDCGAGPSLNFTTGDFTFVFWAREVTPVFNRIIIERGTFGTDGYYLYSNGDGSLAFNSMAGANQTFVSNTTALTTTWKLLAIQRSGTAGKVFVNGVDATASSDVLANIVSSGNSLKLATYNGGNYWSGQLGFSKSVNRALAPNVIYSIYQSERRDYGV